MALPVVLVVPVGYVLGVLERIPEVPRVHQEYSVLSQVGLDEVSCVPGVLERVPDLPRLSWVSPCFSQLRLCLPPTLGYTSHPFLFVAGLENEFPQMKEGDVFKMTAITSLNADSFQNE